MGSSAPWCAAGTWRASWSRAKAGTHITLTVEDQIAREMLARQTQPSTGRLAPRLGEYLQASTEARFKSQTGPNGRPWAPLKYLGISPADDAETRAITRRGW